MVNPMIRQEAKQSIHSLSVQVATSLRTTPFSFIGNGRWNFRMEKKLFRSPRTEMLTLLVSLLLSYENMTDGLILRSTLSNVDAKNKRQVPCPDTSTKDGYMGTMH